jgi:hypothetical protein
MSPFKPVGDEIPDDDGWQEPAAPVAPGWDPFVGLRDVLADAAARFDARYGQPGSGSSTALGRGRRGGTS